MCVSFQDYIARLTPEQMKTQMLKLLQSGHATLDLLEQFQLDSQPEAVMSRPSWCSCGRCREQERPKEQKCCRGRGGCVTLSPEFAAICMNREVLSCVARRHLDWLVEPQPDLVPNNLLRKAGYRQYTAWKYHYLGPGNRKCPPSCVVWAVRGKYPSPDGMYMGFEEE